MPRNAAGAWSPELVDDQEELVIETLVVDLYAFEGTSYLVLVDEKRKRQLSFTFATEPGEWGKIAILFCQHDLFWAVFPSADGNGSDRIPLKPMPSTARALNAA